MNIPEATIVISLVIVLAQGLGAILNDRRFSKLREDLTPIRERLARVETALRLDKWTGD
jgi:hypothetical protein